MNKTLAIAAFALIAVIMVSGSIMPAMAAKDDNNGKAMGCEKANVNSKAAEKNPHCGADLEVSGPAEVTREGPRRGVATYTVTITNNGPPTAENIVITGTNHCETRQNGCGIPTVPVLFPTNWDGVLGSGESVDLTVRSHLFTTSITVSITSDTIDRNLDNNSLVTIVNRR